MNSRPGADGDASLADGTVPIGGTYATPCPVCMTVQNPDGGGQGTAMIGNGVKPISDGPDVNCNCSHPVDCTAGSVQFTGAVISGTDVANNPPAPTIQLVRSFPVDFSQVCADTLPDGNLLLEFLSGQIQYAEIGGVTITVGGTATGLDGTVVYDDNNDPTTGSWVNLLPEPRAGGVVLSNFNNPNPGGVSWIKIFATPGAGAFAGLRNYQLRIRVAP